MDMIIEGKDGVVNLKDVAGIEAVGNMRVKFILKNGREISMYGNYHECVEKYKKAIIDG